MRYHVLPESSDHTWVLDLDGHRDLKDAEGSIRWQRQGGFTGITYVCTPVSEKRGVWKIVEIHNVTHLNNSPRHHVGDEITPVNSIYMAWAWEEMLNRFWPGEGV